MFCNYCRAELPQTAKYCWACGKAFRGTPGSQTAEARATPSPTPTASAQASSSKAARDWLEFSLEPAGTGARGFLAHAIVGQAPRLWNVVAAVVYADGSRDAPTIGQVSYFDISPSEPIELLSGQRRQSAEEQLAEARAFLQREGWRYVGRGNTWYAWRFEREA